MNTFANTSSSFPTFLLLTSYFIFGTDIVMIVINFFWPLGLVFRDLFPFLLAPCAKFAANVMGIYYFLPDS